MFFKRAFVPESYYCVHWSGKKYYVRILISVAITGRDRERGDCELRLSQRVKEARSIGTDPDTISSVRRQTRLRRSRINTGPLYPVTQRVRSKWIFAGIITDFSTFHRFRCAFLIILKFILTDYKNLLDCFSL